MNSCVDSLALICAGDGSSGGGGGGYSPLIFGQMDNFWVQELNQGAFSDSDNLQYLQWVTTKNL